MNVNQGPIQPLFVSILDNLEKEIQMVIDASVPNKLQNRAAKKMSADYFEKSRNTCVELSGAK